MPRFVIVNDAKPTELASKLAGFRERAGDTAMAQEYMQWQYVLPEEDPHTYGSLARAEESRDDLRRESRNEKINVYRLVTEDVYSNMLAALEELVAVPNKHRPERVWDDGRKAIAKATAE